jgi:putative transposase
MMVRPSHRRIHLNRLSQEPGPALTSTRVVGIFPNDPAITRLVRAILLEQNGEWAIQRAQYMTLETVAASGDDSVVGLPVMAI